MKELADNRRSLKREKDLLAKEAKDIDPSDKERFNELQRRRGLDAERKLREAEMRLEERKKEAEQQRAEASRTEESKKVRERAEHEEAEMQRRKMLRDEQRWQNEAEEEERRKRNQAGVIAQMNRQVMDDAKQARLQHEADIRAMRAETDRMEREMLAKLELVRQAKREGRAVDLNDIRFPVQSESPLNAKPATTTAPRRTTTAADVSPSEATSPASSDLDVSPAPQSVSSGHAHSPPSTSPISWSRRQRAGEDADAKSALSPDALLLSPANSTAKSLTPVSPATSVMSNASLARVC